MENQEDHGKFQIGHKSFGVNLVSPQYPGKYWRNAFKEGDTLTLQCGSEDLECLLSFGGNIQKDYVELVTENMDEGSALMLTRIELNKDPNNIFGEFVALIKGDISAAIRRNAKTRKNDRENLEANFYNDISRKRRLKNEEERTARVAQQEKADRTTEYQEAFIEQANILINTYKCTIREGSGFGKKRIPRYFQFAINVVPGMEHVTFEKMNLLISEKEDDFADAQRLVLTARTIQTKKDKKVSVNISGDDFQSFTFGTEDERKRFLDDWHNLKKAAAIKTKYILNQERNGNLV